MKKVLFASIVLLSVQSEDVLGQDSGSPMNTVEAVAESVFTETERQKIKDFFKQRRAEIGGDRAAEAEAREDEEELDVEDSGRGKKDKGPRGNANKSTPGGGKPEARGRGAQAAQGAMPSLPPGIAKNLERGKAMPPGIRKNYLPDDLENELPAREGQSRVVVDDDVVLIDNETDVIIDVIQDVLGNMGN